MSASSGESGVGEIANLLNLVMTDEVKKQLDAGKTPNVDKIFKQVASKFGIDDQRSNKLEYGVPTGLNNQFGRTYILHQIQSLGRLHKKKPVQLIEWSNPRVSVRIQGTGGWKQTVDTKRIVNLNVKAQQVIDTNDEEQILSFFSDYVDDFDFEARMTTDGFRGDFSPPWWMTDAMELRMEPFLKEIAQMVAKRKGIVDQMQTYVDSQHKSQEEIDAARAARAAKEALEAQDAKKAKDAKKAEAAQLRSESGPVRNACTAERTADAGRDGGATTLDLPPSSLAYKQAKELAQKLASQEAQRAHAAHLIQQKVAQQKEEERQLALQDIGHKIQLGAV